MLTTLNLGSNDLGETSCVAIAGALERNTTLTELDLSRNFLGEGFGVAVAGAVERNTTLMTLNLRYNYLSEVGGAVVAGVLRGTPRSRHWILGTMVLEKVVAIIGSLERNTTLTILNLRYIILAKSGVQLLQAHWRGTPRSRHWILCTIGLEKAGV